MRNESDELTPNEFRFMGLSLRFAVLPLTAVSLWLMAADRQANDAYGKVEFRNIAGFKYLVCMNVISLIYAFASAVLSCLGRFNSDWVFFILDQVVAYLMVTSASAAAEVVYLAYQGDTKVSWSEGCSYYGRFCGMAKASLALHFVAFLCFIALSLVSAYMAFRKLEPPLLSASSKEVASEQVE